MDYIFLIASSVIILACLYFIVSPFFTEKGESQVLLANGEEGLSLEAVYGAVNELEMDYLMKKVKEQDYIKLKEQYQILAAGLMQQDEIPKKKQNSAQKKANQVELELLDELQKLRKQRGR